MYIRTFCRYVLAFPKSEFI